MMQLMLRDESVAQTLLSLLVSFPKIKNSESAGIFLRDELEAVRSRLPLPFLPLLIVARYSPVFATRLFSFGTGMFARKFVAGNGAEEIAKRVRSYRRMGFRVNLDILDEKVQDTEHERQCLRALFSLLNAVKKTLTGENLSFSVKLSSFNSQVDWSAPEMSAKGSVDRLRPFVQEVKALDGHIYLDAEEYEFIETYLEAFEMLYREYGSTVRPVLQAYLRRSPEFLERLIGMNNSRDPISMRLVRGAYWDHERYAAQDFGWEGDEIPVFTEKAETDANFHFLFEEGSRRGLIVNPATHNITSIVRIIRTVIDQHLPFEEFQMLGGMGEPLARVLHAKGWPVRFYLGGTIPEETYSLSHGVWYARFGFLSRGSQQDINEAIGFLVRRIVENSSQFSFLAQHRGPLLKAALMELKTIPYREVQYGKTNGRD